MLTPPHRQGDALDVLDVLALAYADDPRHLAELLLGLADAAAHHAHAADAHTATDYGRDLAGAAADAARDRLAAALDLPLIGDLS